MGQPLCEPLEPRLLLSAHPTGGSVPVERLIAFLPVRHASLGDVALAASTGEIRGTVWNDLKGDGVHDSGDPGIEGMAVFLDTNRNGQLDSDETFTATDGKGNYRFTGLAAGSYVVGLNGYLGWTQTSPPPQSPLTENYIAMTEHAGTIRAEGWFDTPSGPTNRITKSFAGDMWTSAYYEVTATLSDPQALFESVLADARNDGVQSGTYSSIEMHTHCERYGAGEHAAVALARVDSQWEFRVGNQNVLLHVSGEATGADPSETGYTLYDETAGQTVRTATFTVMGGSMDDTLLANHVYSLEAHSWSEAHGYGDPGAIMTFLFQAPVIRGEEQFVTVGEGQVVQDVDFGNRASPPNSSAVICGRAWRDHDADGQRDADDPSLAGVVVFLDINRNGVWDTGDRTTLTDSAGAYVFDGLPAGEYLVGEVAPAGFKLTFPGVAGSTGMHQLTLTAWQIFSDADFGFSMAGDANGDGEVDVGDLAILGANYGRTSGATWAMGDFTGDGAVDVGDLGILGANYGRTLAGLLA